MKNIITKILCALGCHTIVHKAWKEHIATGVNLYHSMRHCKNCDYVESHKQDYD